MTAQSLDCKKHDAVLIRIPEVPSRLPLETLVRFILRECKRLDFTPRPKLGPKFKVDFASAYHFESVDALKRLSKLARKHGGKCLSTSFMGSKVKLLFQCRLKHQWLATPEKIMNGRWCRACTGKAPLSIELLRQVALKRGGECLSISYRNAQTKMTWKCARGHIWKTKANHIRSGHWCPICARRKS